MTEEILLQRGSHQISATLYGKSTQGILLCPPHPEYGGNREDLRLVAIATELANSGMSALCIDYSEYTGGNEEIKDTLFALEYMHTTMGLLGILGYSYGAVVASHAASQNPGLQGLVLIAPLLKIDNMQFEFNSTCKKLFIYGLNDNFVKRDIEKVYQLSQGEKHKFSLDTDHFFAGYEDVLAIAVRDFFLKIQKSSG